MSTPINAAIIGVGISYPPRFLPNGRLATSSGGDLVAEAIASIECTQPGERVMLPDYGANVGTFEPVDGDRAVMWSREQIQTHEPRAQNVDIRLEPTNQSGIVNKVISFSVAGEATPRTLTFPIFEGS